MSRYGYATQKVVDALADGQELGLDDLALIVYGINGDAERRSVGQLVSRLRRELGVIVERRSVYRIVGLEEWRHGKLE